MANLSDAHGTIRVKNVGKEFLETFNPIVKDAMYQLYDIEDVRDVEPSEDISFPFIATGRWSYENNIRGYLDGGFTDVKIEDFLKVLVEKNGSIEIEYADSEPGVMFLGKGFARLLVINGEPTLQSGFTGMDYTIKNYAYINGLTTGEALDSMYGDEVLDDYEKYLKDCTARGVSPLGEDDWFNREYPEGY